MTYDIPEDVDAEDERIAERLKEFLFNELGLPLDSYLITTDGDGSFTIDTNRDPTN